MHAFAVTCFALAAWTALLFVVNLALYREPAAHPGTVIPAEAKPQSGSHSGGTCGLPSNHVIAVIIPARNEEAGIAACVQSVLASTRVTLDCLVVDDHSTDRTGEICEVIAAHHANLRVTEPPALPAGWNGKQHACWQGAQHSNAPVLLFLDADVRLHPDALHRMADEMQRQNAALISGIPHQQTGTLLETMLIPLIPFLLLGYLPFPCMRWTRLPGFAAGCGQFLMVRRDAYLRADGHAAIRATMHDGIKLPRLLRNAGERTTMASLENLATCRMYTSSAAVWHGLGKNATEGLASAANILPFTALLLLGQVAPAVVLIAAWYAHAAHTALLRPHDFTLLLAALAFGYAPRVWCALLYRQSWLGALLHPADILVLLALQWWAFLRKLAGRQPVWKERAYQAG